MHNLSDQKFILSFSRQFALLKNTPAHHAGELVQPTHIPDGCLTGVFVTNLKCIQKPYMVKLISQKKSQPKFQKDFVHRIIFLLAHPTIISPLTSDDALMHFILPHTHDIIYQHVYMFLTLCGSSPSPRGGKPSSEPNLLSTPLSDAREGPPGTGAGRTQRGPLLPGPRRRHPGFAPPLWVTQLHG